MQRVFGMETFLWGFIVAWGNSEKTGDEEFMAGQLRAMKKFNQKSGIAAMGGAIGSGICHMQL